MHGFLSFSSNHVVLMQCLPTLGIISKYEKWIKDENTSALEVATWMKGDSRGTDERISMRDVICHVMAREQLCGSGWRLIGTQRMRKA